MKALIAACRQYLPARIRIVLGLSFVALVIAVCAPFVFFLSFLQSFGDWARCLKGRILEDIEDMSVLSEVLPLAKSMWSGDQDEPADSA